MRKSHDWFKSSLIAPMSPCANVLILRFALFFEIRACWHFAVVVLNNNPPFYLFQTTG